MSLYLLIASSIPSLTPDDTIEHTIALMEDNKLTHLPVVEDDNYIALAQENDLYEVGDHQIPLSVANKLTYKPAINISKHPYEAIKLFYEMNLSALPVTDEENKYAGCITKETIIKYFAEQTLLNAPGGVIVIEIPGRSYSLCEIARICENEDVLVINVHAVTNAEGHLEVTLKTNKTILDALVSSFERYSYNVKEVYSEQMDKDDIVRKYNMLMNYINM